MPKTILLLFLILLFKQDLISASIGRDEVSGSGLLLNSNDSIYETLSVTERINQLLMIDTRNSNDSLNKVDMEIGGILLGKSSASNASIAINRSDEQLRIPPLIFAELGEGIELNVNGVEVIASKAVFEKIHDPHLFYASGLVLARQCHELGISAITQESISQCLGENDFWKASEFVQGLKDGGLINQDVIKIINPDEFFTEGINELSEPFLVHIRQDEILDFHTTLQGFISSDRVSMEHLDVLIKRILIFKSEIKKPDVQPEKLKQSLKNLQFELGKASIEIINDPNRLIPVRELAGRKIALIDINSSANTFYTYSNKYTQVDLLEASYGNSSDVYEGLWNKLKNHDLIICGLHQPMNNHSEDYEGFNEFLSRMNNAENSIVVSFLDIDLLLDINKHLPETPLVIAPEDTELFHLLTPQLIFGGIGLGAVIAQSETNKENRVQRFTYSYPESVDLNSQVMNRIDSIAQFAIVEKAMPGCQILVAKDNEIIYQKSFGFYTYDSIRAVTNEDIYDLASVTKVSGALPGLMKLYEEGKFDLDATLGTYLKYFNKGDKKRLTFREILAHQSGLIPWIPYWKTTMKKNGKFRFKTLSNVPSENYPYEIAENLYLHKSYKKKIYKQIRKTKLGEKKYLYSGLIFYVFPDIIEDITGKDYEEYIYSNFYKPLGATTLTYNPLNRFEIDHIVPTEYDSLFRKSQIHGKVHDEGAAMMEGVSSNAGLFSNANDLAKIWQMYCNYGVYGGRQYLKEETVREFARCQYPENENRRGLGFDRPLPEPHEKGNTAVSVSQFSFGHSGFTGTFAWADPQYNLVYIFLSNRVYPTRENTKLYNLNIRTGIQQVIYDAME